MVEMGSTGNRTVRQAVTLRDVAAAAKVHVATASRALDAETAHPVSRETRARVQRVAKELGYRHHMMARGLRRGFSSTVGVVVADLGNAYTPPVLRGLERSLERADYMALVTESRDDSQALERAVGHLLARQVDGLVLLAVRSDDLARVVGWTSWVPVVLAVRSLPGSGVPAVTHDDLGGARLAAGHLAELGHRRVVQLPGPWTCSRSGTATTASPRPRPASDSTCGGAGGRPADRRGGPAADGAGPSRPARGHRVFAHNDLMPWGRSRPCAPPASTVPRDLSVVGSNDVAHGRLPRPAAHHGPPGRPRGGPPGRRGRAVAIRGLPVPQGDPPVPAELVVRASAAPYGRP
jgi:LacI family transcriptional regulator